VRFSALFIIFSKKCTHKISNNNNYIGIKVNQIVGHMNDPDSWSRE